ncbi:calcium-binding protein [Pseudomonas sp. CIP-10]|uniref:calcium-binding protein n=1 Tax=Pseudomonas sp. CIP-10 TaxID=2892442 RepID=UPI00227D7766|nr:hypothetical protein [Pseudomonas sp. CIP-10]
MSLTTDTNSPNLSSLRIPQVIDLSAGAEGLTIDAAASDDISGIKNIQIWFDKNFTYSYTNSDQKFSSSLLLNQGLSDSWVDGSSSQTWNIAETNPPGIYNVTSVVVEDLQGNTRTYSPSELSELGVNTSVLFENPTTDATPPNLISLEIPSTIDLSSDSNGLTINATASDDLSGVKNIQIWFDKNFTYSYANSDQKFSSNLLLNSGLSDSWLDGYSSQTWNIAGTNRSETYNITSVAVEDLQGNTRTYSSEKLIGLGVNTSILFKNSTPDVTPPSLTSLKIPTTIALSSGTNELTIGATASDDLSGIKNIQIWLDKNITYSYTNSGQQFSSNLLLNQGLSDSWLDGNSAQTWHIAATNPYGAYNITSVSIEDQQGNIRNYSTNELTSLGINTSIRFVASKSTLTSADDYFSGSSYADWVLGLDGNDRMYGLAGDDLLEGGNGDDVLDGGAGADTMIGGMGNDTYYVDNVNDVVSETSANGGIDTVISSVTRTLGANQENLILTGTADLNGYGNNLDNKLTGNAAANVLNGGAGADTMIGGMGNDTYYVDNVNDVVSETSANGGIDTVISSVTRTLGANQENLILTGTADLNGYGNNLDNKLTGNAAANVLNGGAGADTMIGGMGNDTYYVDNVNDVVSETSANGGIDTVISSVTRTLGANQENLILTGTADLNGYGNNLDNKLTGNAAANVLNGGAGADTMIGGMGNDTYYVDNVNDVVSETSANGGIDTVISSVTRTLGANQENLILTGTADLNGYGNNLDNKLTGNAAANVLNGGAGADTMIGGMGNDTYYVDNVNDVVSETSANGGIDTVVASVTWTLGSNQENLVLNGGAEVNGYGNHLANKMTGNYADNVLDGGAGDDRIWGGGGNDHLIGGSGKDTLTGGEGSDTFYYKAVSDTGTTSQTWDVITDFVHGIDKIDLTMLDANTTTFANDAFHTIISSDSAFTAAGQLKLANGILYGNMNSDSTPEFAIQLLGVSTIDLSDFAL